jgi:hypothetical protein
VNEWTNVDAATMRGGWLFRVCDEAVVRSGKLGDRDLFVYREGFYRGTSMGMLWLSIGILALAARLEYVSKVDSIKVGSMEFTPSRLLFLAVIVAISAFLLWKRFWRFAHYRVTQALIASLLLEISGQPDEPAGPAEPPPGGDQPPVAEH